MNKLWMIALCAGISLTLSAQQPAGRGGFRDRHAGPTKELMQRLHEEKVAYITQQVGLSPKEAEHFWPLYNRIEEEQQVLYHNEKKSYHALRKALESGEGNLAELLDAYLDAKSRNISLHLAARKDYMAILPAEKVARFYVADEQFRREQIGKLRGGHPGRPEQGAEHGPGQKPEREPEHRPER